MLYTVTVKPTHVVGAVNHPSFELMLYTELKPSVFMPMLKSAHSNRYVNIKEMNAKQTAKIMHNGSYMELNEAVIKIYNTDFTLEVKTEHVSHEHVQTIVFDQNVSVWNSDYGYENYHFFRVENTPFLNDYQNKLIHNRLMSELAELLYEKFNIELHSGNNCKYFKSNVYQLDKVDDKIILSKEVTETTTEFMTI